ncbi:hypothetical protein GCM10009092_30790 [Bowmanella denitrificans]|uniref:Beta-lactamase-related domain-containing protein n=1 Tax=Bowmanella denitrificans TaxID=366582 RepID=A0ABN0XHJ8_9ALTE
MRFILLLVSLFISVFGQADEGDLSSQTDYQTLLQQFHLTGLSVAVVDDFQLVYQHQAGEKVYGSGQLIGPDTAFSTASMSKPVTATLAFMLAEAGKLDMDAPVERYLKRWHLPASDFDMHRQLSIRQLLSHTGGTNQSGFADFYQGDDIPTLLESLNGIKLPRYKEPLHLTFAPGSDWNYSGGGYVLVQVALEDITGKSLAQLAREMLFVPLNMQHTTMVQPGDEGFLTDVAKVHDEQQQIIGSGLPICPQIAPSGMWSSAADLSRFLLDYQLALAGKPSKVISRNVARQATQIQTLKKMGGWSAGWMRFEASGNLDWFSHGGSNTGTGGTMMATMQDGKAIVILANGPNPARLPVINLLIEDIIARRDWRKPLPSGGQQPGPEVLQAVLGEFQPPYSETPLKIYQQDGRLYYQGTITPWSAKRSGELIYQGNGLFASDDQPNLLGVQRHAADGLTYLTIRRGMNGMPEPLMPKR